MANRSANRKEVEVMSEQRNGEDVDSGWRTFTLEATNPDYNITVRVREDGFQGCDPASVFLLANRDGYNHVYSNEKSSAGNGYMKSNPSASAEDRAAFEHSWMLQKREAIVDGSYSRNGRGGPRGPRISKFDQELRDLIDTKLILPLLLGNPLPKSGKTEISGHTLDYWRDYCKNKPAYAYLHDEARANIKARADATAAAKAQASSIESAFASL